MVQFRDVIYPPVGVPLVHILLHGYPLCDGTSKLGIPHDWPKGHKWVTVDESDDATCIDCKQVYKRYRSARSRR